MVTVRVEKNIACLSVFVRHVFSKSYQVLLAKRDAYIANVEAEKVQQKSNDNDIYFLSFFFFLPSCRSDTLKCKSSNI